MKQRIQKRILELSHKVSETEKDLELICTKLNTDLLSSSTFTKTTMSSTRSFHASDAEILSHLQATHPEVVQIRVPTTVAINLSSTNEQKQQSTIEINKPSTSLIQPSTPKQTNSSIIEPESFKNMLRLVRTSIDLVSGAASPEQLQELSNAIATSPLSSSQKSNITSINKTPTIPKTTSLSKTTTTITKPLQTTMAATNILQTPAKSVSSPIPTISVTPATPAAQVFASDTSVKLQPNKPIVQTPTDLTKTQSMSGDNAIRSLLNNTMSSPTTVTSIPSQPIANTTPVQAAKPPFFGNVPTTSMTQVPSQSSVVTTTTTTPAISTPTSAFGSLSPASMAITSVQSTSPTNKPIMSTGFGSKPIFGSLTPTTSSSLSFGGGGAAAPTTTGTLFGSAATSTAPSSTPFSTGFGAAISTTATTSAPSTSAFSLATSSLPSPFGSGFGASPTITTPAPTSSIFGASATSSSSPFGSGFGSAPSPTTTSAPSTGIFGGGFGGSNTTAPSPFGSSFGATTTTSSSSPFGASPSISTGSPFGAGSSLAPTSSTGTFGSSAFGFNPTSPANSTATSTVGTSPFGSSFTGFNTQSSSSGSSTGFQFGGFGSQPSDATKTQSGFGSFGSPPTATQGSSPFGSSLFGGASGQSSGFGSKFFISPKTKLYFHSLATSSSFGAPSTQSTNSSSFTTYRK
jgi:hypothetical protein